MALTTRTLPSLMNGVSKQPAILRSPDQTEDELNTFGQIATGLTRRPPTETIAEISGLTLGDALVHHINRDVTERYLVLIDEGSIRVFDEITGDEKTVSTPAGGAGFAYLDAPGTAYRAITIADYTFIVNTEKVVTMKGTGADEVDQDAFLRLPGGTTVTGTNGNVFDQLIAGALTQYKPNPTSPGSVTGSVPSADKLPTTVCSGCIYRVLGDKDTSFVSYYVMGDGSVWNETVVPGLKNAIDETTMPHALIRESDGTFMFAPFTWKPRRVGDHETNPYPPFISRTIRDIFFYQNRLGFLVDESVVFSVAGDYGDFWRRTVLDYIDSDALAAAATTTDVAILDYAVPFSDGVMLFSRQRQLSLTNGDSGLSAHSLAIQPVTRYVMSPNVRPSPLGSQVHFATDSGGFTAVQEYTRLAGADPTEAADITAHVPGLIPSGASQLISAPDLNALFVLVNNAEEAERTKLYVYQFFWDADKKLLSAWRPWDFGDGKPISGAYLSGHLHLLMERPDGYFLERINLAPNAVSEGQEHIIYLDRQVFVGSSSYDAVNDQTVYVLPFEPDPDKFRMVHGAPTGETMVDPETYIISGNEVRIPGLETVAVTVGHVFTTSVTFTEQFPVDWQGRPLSTGRLQLHNWTVQLRDTAYTRARVYPYGLNAAAFDPQMVHESVFTGKSLGDAGLVLGERVYGNLAFTFSVASNSKEARIELINDTPFGSTWVSGEWEGLFFSRAL